VGAGALLTPISDPELAERARKLKWLLLDVDGVLTDGRLVYGPSGEEQKVFHVRDGLGLRLLQRSGVKLGIISGRESDALKVRSADLGIDWLAMERVDKGPAFAEFLAAQEAAPEQVAFIGDDLVDLPILLHCGLSFAPADAVPEIRERVHRVLREKGGWGAVRELCELLIRARGDWERLTAPFFASGEPG
jgi:3-deoxy-D-manno-octulosonate 8-phosphate phosphatase (KDO 8-P phosphatase)